MVEAAGFVTAGGRSSRMGCDKAWLDIGGGAMIERVIAALTPVTSSVAVIANDDKYLKLGLPVYVDREPGLGPLGAIRTALENSPTDLVLLLGCDLPFVTAPLLSHLLSRAEGYEVVVPLDAEGREEPLCAVYSRPALTAVVELIRSYRLKVSHLFDRAKTLFVPFQEIASLPGSQHLFRNVNTPEDYKLALEVLGTSNNG